MVDGVVPSVIANATQQLAPAYGSLSLTYESVDRYACPLSSTWQPLKVVLRLLEVGKKKHFHTLTLAVLCSPTDVRNWITHADDFAIAYIALTPQLYQLANRSVPTQHWRLKCWLMAGVCLPIPGVIAASATAPSGDLVMPAAMVYA